MLSLLKIQNLALVDQLVWQLGSGLIGVTGETGAGKSVIVGALKLILGERAEKSLIRRGESSLTVEAVFDLARPEMINRILAESGIDACDDDQLIIKRTISASSNKQFINNSPATLSVLKRLGEHLVDLHGPHDHQSLLSTERQLAMLDAYAGAEKVLAKYHKAWREWHATQSELERVIAAEQASDQEIEILRHQIDEIDAAQIVPAEYEELEHAYKRASNASRLNELTTQIVSILSGSDEAVMNQLAGVQRLSRDLERMDPELTDLLTGAEKAVFELQEIELGLMDYAQGLDAANLAELEERINLLESLKRKYGPSLEDVLERRDKAAKRLDEIENRGEKIDQLEQKVAELRKLMEDAGAQLSQKRRKAAPRLAKEVGTHLKELGFKQSVFEVPVKAQEPQSNGLEGVDFEFGPNPGEPAMTLRSIASSGEMSRVMLALKSALAEQDATPLMVFDEIDANVGGEIARSVGVKMAKLGARHQVIAITHFPQVAAVANSHFVVRKLVVDGRTNSELVNVAEDKRVDEIVRMLGTSGDEARAMAERLLEMQ
ncbi:DNA repair protein RecN [Persicirhabdus sediminis]|uniref:DNA repair protein RecN n=1 Tax=Persicirhabdus sediminis TaxID=454144 RepID=A0A8J7MBG3_9BACT|nr:DNA repair protein RecN [Persicirhabdus sediminis]MBK1789968.1 DNA repair protein RecN [Persicirhabdus sediminis]